LVPLLSYVLQESTSSTPIAYQRKSKSDMLQKQLQSLDLEVSAENDSSVDSQISHICDIDPVDIPIAFDVE